MAMSTLNIMQNTAMMPAFLCSDASSADSVLRFSMYARLSTNKFSRESLKMYVVFFAAGEIVLLVGCQRKQQT